MWWCKGPKRGIHTQIFEKNIFWDDINEFGSVFCEKCNKFKCLSKADKERHVKILHGGKRALNNDNKTSKRTRCTFVKEDETICNLEFTTYYKLRKHKNEQNPLHIEVNHRPLRWN